ncbi:DUF4330 domain-containing protein [Salinibaculum rarum]|uniref:DUF4330 domain-containing protein n=1 Tax=Salinibaculum rarum TaxID=3058903 RepID=UPI00265D70DE|nr:DUF4330 domain-containing protein [Salinibaculum sp. KK48]
MEVIDENGRVFGVVNVIDLLVVLLLLAVVAAGAALVLGTGGESNPETATITIRADGVEPYVADAVPAVGDVDGGNVTSIENKTVEPATIITTNSAGDVLVREHPRLKTVTVTVIVNISQTDGTPMLDQQRLKVGNSVGLDLGTVDLRGNVTAIEREQ